MEFRVFRLLTSGRSRTKGGFVWRLFCCNNIAMSQPDSPCRRAGFRFFLTAVFLCRPILLSHAAGSAFVRVNQAGYQPAEIKRAVLMATSALSGTFNVVSNGTTVFSAAIPSTNAGSWTTTFTNTYLLDFSSVTYSGVYTIQVASTVNATSPPVSIGTAPALYRPLLTNALFYFQSSRDGPNVITNVISRKPSHTNDEAAMVYLPPNVYNGKRQPRRQPNQCRRAY